MYIHIYVMRYRNMHFLNEIAVFNLNTGIFQSRS